VNFDDDMSDDGEYVDCWDCGGEGVTHHDCGEDTCCCANPEDNVVCDTCGGHRMLKLDPGRPSGKGTT
jgi:hypothetical protein